MTSLSPNWNRTLWRWISPCSSYSPQHIAHQHIAQRNDFEPRNPYRLLKPCRSRLHVACPVLLSLKVTGSIRLSSVEIRLQVLTPLSLLINIATVLVCSFVLHPSLGLSSHLYGRVLAQLFLTQVMSRVHTRHQYRLRRG
jgi:hypothetical protein